MIMFTPWLIPIVAEDDESYHGLLPHDRFRKIPHTADVWEVAELM